MAKSINHKRKAKWYLPFSAIIFIVLIAIILFPLDARAEFETFDENVSYSFTEKSDWTNYYSYISGDRGRLDWDSHSFPTEELSGSVTYIIVASCDTEAPAAGGTSPEGSASHGTPPPGAIDPDNPLSPDPALTGPEPERPISDAALPLAVGAAALVTALGALGLAVSGGVTPAEAFAELKALFGSAKETALPEQALSRNSQEIINDPRLHDRVTDVKGKQWVYYHRPGDLAGDGWTSMEDYNQTLAQENEGKFWTDRYGWQTREELAGSEQMAEKFAADNREATAKSHEKLKELQSPPPAELPQTELPGYLNGQERELFAAAVNEAVQKNEQETDNILKELVASERRHRESVARSDRLGREIELEGKKATFALQLAEDTEKLRQEGYWVRNPYNSITIDRLNMLHSPLDARGVRCGDLVDLRYEDVRKKAVEMFGEGVIVDKVVIEERSTAAPKGVLDQLDRVLEYNHTANRVITPDGEAFIVDDWEALHTKGSTRGLMQPEEKFIEHWKHSKGPNDYHHYSYRPGNMLDGHDTTLNQFIIEHGSEEGLRLWQADASRRIEENIKIPDPDKDAYAKQMETLVKYMKKNTDKIGF